MIYLATFLACLFIGAFIMYKLLDFLDKNTKELIDDGGFN